MAYILEHSLCLYFASVNFGFLKLTEQIFIILYFYKMRWFCKRKDNVKRINRYKRNNNEYVVESGNTYIRGAHEEKFTLAGLARNFGFALNGVIFHPPKVTYVGVFS